jgi:hypothetical protein
VLATTMGEEAFLDDNGDGLLTRSASISACPPGYTCECDNNGTVGTYAGCITSQPNSSSNCQNVTTCGAVPAFGAGSKRSEGFIDLGEPFYDKNDNGTRDNGSVAGAPFEEFIDANTNGVYDPPNGVWDGPGCKSTGCLTSKMIWNEITLVFTYDTFSFWPDGDATNCRVNYGGCSATFDNGPFAVAPAFIQKGSSGAFCVNIGDANLNSPPGGTVVNATATVGTVAPASVTIPDGLSGGPYTYCFYVTTEATAAQNTTTVTASIGSTLLGVANVALAPPPAPSAPTGVSANALPTAGSIRVSWNPVSTATSYNIYYSTVNGVTKLNGTKIGPFTSSPADVASLTSGTTYYFVVTAVNAGGESSESTQASATAP